jgi:hypothetical protein
LAKTIDEVNLRYQQLSMDKKNLQVELDENNKKLRLIMNEKDKLVTEHQVTLDAKFQAERETKAQELISKHWQERYESLIREQNQSENEWNTRWNRLLNELENERNSKHATTSEQQNEAHKLQAVIVGLENQMKIQSKELAASKENQLALQLSTAAADLNETKHALESCKM